MIFMFILLKLCSTKEDQKQEYNHNVQAYKSINYIWHIVYWFPKILNFRLQAALHLARFLSFLLYKCLNSCQLLFNFLSLNYVKVHHWRWFCLTSLFLNWFGIDFFIYLLCLRYSSIDFSILLLFLNYYIFLLFFNLF